MVSLGEAFLFFFCHHSITHPGRCWRWTQTPGSLSGSSLTGESAPCSASAWTKKKKKRKYVHLFYFYHTGEAKIRSFYWGIKLLSVPPVSYSLVSTLCLIGVAGSKLVPVFDLKGKLNVVAENPWSLMFFRGPLTQMAVKNKLSAPHCKYSLESSTDALYKPALIP